MIILIDKKGRREKEGHREKKGGGVVMERRGRERERGKEKPGREGMEGRKEGKQEGRKEGRFKKQRKINEFYQ